MRRTERIPVVVIGGGQAGLATGYYLERAGIPFVILDAGVRVGDAWRERWDSLRLFSPSFYDGLPGMRFPGPAFTWPTKDQMGDYLERYAKRFQLPVRLKTRVTLVRRQGGEFLVESTAGTIHAEQVVVAMSNYQKPRIPAFARQLDPVIRQFHSTTYRNPAQLAPGSALVVGAGNSGADIAMDLIDSRATLLAGRDVGHIPFRIETPAARYLFVHLVRFIGHHVLSLGTPIGRKARPGRLHAATPLVRIKPGDLIAAGVERVPRVVGAQNGQPLLEDGRVLDVRNVVWCTGFEPANEWIDLPIFDANRDPQHRAGIVDAAPGFYFVGLNFLYSATSATVNGVGRDARRIVEAITARRSTRTRERRPRSEPVARMA
ncbi:MAG TPA: NAD(P)-binding domain-containing protein [Gemmatimonadales bacterium]|nr:NAD(P)-binding domain-containing protein [Gemmatimonadales bacterium]